MIAMADKHAALNEDEIATSQLSNELKRLLRQLPADARVLDWGCGRGRTTLHLRDAGFNAWGVDVEPAVIAKADAALHRRGLSKAGILRRVDELADFPPEYFHLIFSEETIEHVIDIEQLAIESFRLTTPGGYGLHSFPGSRQWLEPHIKMPFVHWFSSKHLQRAVIVAALYLRKGPQPAWPEACGPMGKPLPRFRQAAIYARYLNEKVVYRPIESIGAIFRDAGFEVEDLSHSPHYFLHYCLPRRWRDNGFPVGNNLLFLRKPAPTITSD